MNQFKILSTLLIFSTFLAAEAPEIKESDIPKKVIQTRNKKAAVLKHKTTVWSKNAAAEFVAERKIGGGEDLPPDQTITGRFHENGTWLETETVIGPYSAKVRQKLMPKPVFNACRKLAKKAGAEDFSGGVTIRDLPGKYTVEATCGEKRFTFDKKAKVLKEE